MKRILILLAILIPMISFSQNDVEVKDTMKIVVQRKMGSLVIKETYKISNRNEYKKLMAKANKVIITNKDIREVEYIIIPKKDKDFYKE
jgi:hypothetical protein